MRETAAQPVFATGVLLHSAASGPIEQNTQLSLSFGERFTAEQLREAWQKVAAAHPALLTSFRREKTTLQREHDGAEAPWRVLDWSAVPPEELGSRWSVLTEEDFAAPVDIGVAPLMRFTAIALPNGHCHILATFPKFLVSEKELFRVIFDWLAALEGGTPRGGTAAESGEDAFDWWKDYLGETAAALHPACQPASSGEAQLENAATIERDDTQALRKLSAEAGIPLRSTLLAAWALVVARLTGHDDGLLLAATTDTENLLPVRVRIDHAARVTDWLKDFHSREVARRGHSGIGLDRLFAAGGRGPAIPPTVFTFLPPSLNDRIHDANPRWINLDARLTGRSQHVLHLEVRDGDRLTLRLASRELTPAEAKKLLDRVVNALCTLAQETPATLKDIDLLTESERRVLAAADVMPAKLPKIRVEEDISDAALAHPDAIAIEGGGGSLTYGDLVAHSESIAAHLKEAGLSEGWNIAVCLTPTTWLPVAVLGVLRAGDTCVPLDCNASKEWLLRQVEACDVEMVLCDSQTAAIFEGTEKKTLVLDRRWEEISKVSTTEFLAPTKHAAVFAGIENGPQPAIRAIDPGVLALACGQAARLWELGKASRVALLAKPGTTAFIEELLSPLTRGSTVVLPDDPTQLDGVTVVRFDAQQWSHALSVWRQGGVPESLQTVLAEDSSHSEFAVWKELDTASRRWIRFHSPVGFSGLGLRFAGEEHSGVLEKIPLGVPGAGISVKLTDKAGYPMPPRFAGKVEFRILGIDEPLATVEAWRDEEGMFIACGAPPKPATPIIILPAPEPETMVEPEIEAAPKEPEPAREWKPLIQLHAVEDAPELFLVHDLDGDPHRYDALAAQFAGEWTLFATSARGAVFPSECHESVESEAADLVRAIRAQSPEGPYNLLGVGYGGVLAFEMARQLLTANLPVEFLVLAGSRAPQTSGGGWLRNLSRSVLKRDSADEAADTAVARAHVQAFRNYKTTPLPGPACVILGEDQGKDIEKDWLLCAPEAFFERIPCATADMLKEPPVKRLAAILRDCVEETRDEL